LAQPGSAVSPPERLAAVGRLTAVPRPEPETALPPVRISTVNPAHVERLLIEAGELEDAA
ncbi:MAG: hypothetical protein KKA73_18865, partial [Chloroflexi bacterium]|nr:hypothetical protein [Chloroflexota bacterium]MBU1749751.1 hypothetical protein [Chloroflexota bacterium]